jgi:hypothetical protein
VRTITANPAAGPLTPKVEPLAKPTTMPPIIPAIIPENNGAPEASATPRHNGSATKKTTILAGRSFLISLNIFFNFYLFLLFFRHFLRDGIILKFSIIFTMI